MRDRAERSAQQPMIETKLVAESRRRFLRQCSGALAAGALASPAEGQSERVQRSEARSSYLKLAKEFRYARLCAISADSAKMCLYFTGHPYITFTIPQEGPVTYDGGSEKDGALAVIEMGSWREMFSAQLRQQPTIAGFFGSSEVLFIDALSFSPGRPDQQVLVELSSGHVEEHLRTVKSGKRLTSYYDLTDHALLGLEYGGAAPGRKALTRVTIPNYRETARVPFVPADAESRRETAIWISNDRKTLVYAFGSAPERSAPGHTIVCRRTSDLNVLWTRQIESDSWGTSWMAITPDGNRIAVAVVDTSVKDQQRQFYIGVYGGQDGAPIATLAINGDYGVALSPGGRLLAVSKLSRDRATGDIQLSVEIYSVASGRQIASVVHGYVPPGRFQTLDANVGSEFTPDGKYLITAGNNSVKVWELE